MAKTFIPSEIWFKNDKNNRKRAYYYSTRAGRAIPVPLADAELWIATNASTQVDGHPFQF